MFIIYHYAVYCRTVYHPLAYRYEQEKEPTRLCIRTKQTDGERPHDTNHLVTKQTDVQLSDKYDAIQLWAFTNKMIINASKTKEIVIRPPNPRNSVELPAIQSIKNNKETKLLCVPFLTRFTLTRT